MTPQTAFLIASLLPWGTAPAQGFPDPTKPPARLLEPAPQEAAQGDGTAPAATGLQAIVRRAGQKPAALINGEYVVQGQRVGDARLVKVGEDFVTLKSSAGNEILYLVSGVDKTPSKKDAKTPKKAGGEGAKK